jgi:acetyltransferase
VNASSEENQQSECYTIRFVTSSDVHPYRRILHNTSSRDRYFRFFHHVKSFDDGELQRYVEPRGDVVNVIAEDGTDPLGVAHAEVSPDGSAEFAVIVADYARRRGVAASLVDRIISALQARGIARLTALSLSDNAPFARLAIACGMESQPEDEDGVVSWSLDLTSLESGGACEGIAV